MRTLLITVLIFLLLTLVVLILVIGQDILLPLMIAIAIWYLIVMLTTAFQSIGFKGYYIPYPLALFCSIIASFASIAWVINILTVNITELIGRSPEYQQRLQIILSRIFEFFHASYPTNFISETTNKIDLIWILSSFANLITTILSSGAVIVFYVIFLLLEYNTFDAKLQRVFKNPIKYDRAYQLIEQINIKIQSYLKVKTLISAATASISYLILIITDVEFASFWALLIFLLNYIPTIGAIIATLLPIVWSLIQFNSLPPFIFVTVSLVSLQFIINNIIEPKILSQYVNLSGLVILFSLAVWNKIWGVPGMFLGIPLVVIANIILSNFPQTKPVSILLSGKRYK